MTELRRYGHTQTLSHKTHRSLGADGFILEQQHKPNVFEYSIFGDSKSTTKIGDFTQSKLEKWSK